MNTYAKITLLAFGVGVASSAVTALAVTSIDRNAERNAIAESVAESVAVPGLYTVSHSATPPTDFTHAAENTINGVVSIKSYATQANRMRNGGMPQFDPLYEFFFGPQQRQSQPRQSQPQEAQLGLGSGVILSADGYIVTNNHVIDGADRLEVTLNDNSTYNAQVIGSDPSTDVALLKIEAENLPVIPVGDSDALKVGEWVLAVGNPFGFTSTVTTGIVSAKARSVGAVRAGGKMGIESYIQTDAAVNPGNSGGALVNVRGELVGINTAIYSQTGNYVGYSFAVPTSIVTKVVTDIKQYGTVQRAVLGVMFLELTPQLAKEKEITAVNDGILVQEVIERSAAMEAGIKPDDVLIAINGSPIHNTAQMQGEISKYRPGDRVTVKYIRDNKEASVDVILQNSQGNTKLTKAKDHTVLGAAFAKLTDEQRREYRLNSGVRVSGLTDGKFKDAGIKEGFVILTINNIRVQSPSEIEEIYRSIMQSNASDKVMFITGIYPTGRKEFFAVDLSD